MENWIDGRLEAAGSAHERAYYAAIKRGAGIKEAYAEADAAQTRLREVLMAVRERLKDASQWIRGAGAGDKHRHSVPVLSDEAVCWCLDGALLVACAPASTFDSDQRGDHDWCQGEIEAVYEQDDYRNGQRALAAAAMRVIGKVSWLLDLESPEIAYIDANDHSDTEHELILRIVDDAIRAVPAPAS